MLESQTTKIGEGIPTIHKPYLNTLTLLSALYDNGKYWISEWA